MSPERRAAADSAALGSVAGRWHHRLSDGRVQCDLCPRRCRLQPGARGFCFVRQRVGDEIHLTSYARAMGLAIDPIEKKPLNHFFPGSSVLSFGTPGCNLGCRFCQNWDMSKARSVQRATEVASPTAIAEAAVRAGCQSVAFTYNEPIVFAEYAIDTARACHERGLQTVAVTAGYITDEARADFFSVMDAANVDLKAFTPGFYRKLCGGELEPVLDTLRYLARETDVWTEVTTLLIPGHNDSEDEIDRLCEWCATELGPDVPLHFSAFHPDFKMTDLARTPAATCQRARQQARARGVHHAYSGNIHDAESQSTYCASCGELVIARDWYALGDYRLDRDRCRACGAPVAGRFAADGPGTWGGRRARVSL